MARPNRGYKRKQNNHFRTFTYKLIIGEGLTEF